MTTHHTFTVTFPVCFLSSTATFLSCFSIMTIILVSFTSYLISSSLLFSSLLFSFPYFSSLLFSTLIFSCLLLSSPLLSSHLSSILLSSLLLSFFLISLDPQTCGHVPIIQDVSLVGNHPQQLDFYFDALCVLTHIAKIVEGVTKRWVWFAFSCQFMFPIVKHCDGINFVKIISVAIYLIQHDQQM